MAFILTNSVHHARLLPAQSRHSFVYTTCSFMMSLSALESHRLDLVSGFFFGYGRGLLRVCGIAPSDFLTHGGGPLSQKLSTVVSRVLGPSFAERVDDAWMLATPTYLGVQMNPLTLWFCYDATRECIAVVLEVHNTFGERHAYALEVNAESAQRARGSSFDHKWIFPKQFHVSPFIERSGFYQCSVIIPSLSPQQADDPDVPSPLPRIQLLVMSSADASAVTLTASQSTVRARPLSSRTLSWAIACMPFSMLLSTVRIFYHAYILHYIKRVDVFRRPEPFGDPEVESHMPSVQNNVQDKLMPSGGLVWQPVGWADVWARRRFEDFLEKRVRELEVVVELRATNPLEPPTFFGENKGKEKLTINYRSLKAFSVILGAPTALHALYAGGRAEKLFATSDDALFCRLFGHSSDVPPSLHSAMNRSIRRLMLPPKLRQGVPASHPLDQPYSMVLYMFLLFQCAILHFERFAFTLVRARFRPGEEPWISWDGFEY